MSNMHQRLAAQATLESKSEDWRHMASLLRNTEWFVKAVQGQLNKID